MERNWAGNHEYAGARLERPASLDELAEVVGVAPRVRAIGSRHSFTDIVDSDVLVSLEALPPVFELDAVTRTVTIGGGARYGEVSQALHDQGWALANLASLPHISVAGAVATGTHGSGDTNASLATAVAGLALVDGSGAARSVRRGDPDHDGTVVGLGALGIVTTLTLDVEPAYDVRQDVWTDLPYAAVADHFDEITSSGYSVSLFTDFSGAGFAQAWVKSRAVEAPAEFFGARAATKQLHPDIGVVAEGVTQQGGIVGPWLERLPHFRLEFTPSHGAELQGEYLVPRARALDALDAFRSLRPRFEGLLRVSELRTVAADDLWLSSAYGTDVVGFHLTWVQDEEAVYAVLPDLEAALLPLGARPHWGKCFAATAADLEPLYPRLRDFRALRERVDPDRTFGNAFLDRVIGG
ncbi:MAG TPA: D-arabinono-1,4-lactone oxidase [Lapillicoccus sp.]|uniref:D-arabinono-1,4-lactone oxidase n=1 Tax=Lapillicoccus sp. TaxID=1909287 RepID=UPI002F94D5B3